VNPSWAKGPPSRFDAENLIIATAVVVTLLPWFVLLVLLIQGK
jgi:hypothetical protein